MAKTDTREKQLRIILEEAEKVPDLLNKIKELEEENESLKPYKDIKDLIYRFCFLRKSRIDSPIKLRILVDFWKNGVRVMCDGVAVAGPIEWSISEFKAFCKEAELLLNDAEELEKLRPTLKEFSGILPEEKKAS